MNHYVVDCNKLRRNDRPRSEVDTTVYLESDFEEQRRRADLSDAKLAGLQDELAALQLRLEGLRTMRLGQLREAYEWGYQDGQNNPNGYSSKAERDKCAEDLAAKLESGQ